MQSQQCAGTTQYEHNHLITWNVCSLVTSTHMLLTHAPATQHLMLSWLYMNKAAKSWKDKMETLITFLESSTIHGLAYIPTGRRHVRLFWILVVIAGFSGAGYLIYESFQSWAESPITTTIETLPIKDITFPKINILYWESFYWRILLFPKFPCVHLKTLSLI